MIVLKLYPSNEVRPEHYTLGTEVFPLSGLLLSWCKGRIISSHSTYVKALSLLRNELENVIGKLPIKSFSFLYIFNNLVWWSLYGGIWTLQLMVTKDHLRVLKAVVTCCLVSLQVALFQGLSGRMVAGHWFGSREWCLRSWPEEPYWLRFDPVSCQVLSLWSWTNYLGPSLFSSLMQ